MCSKKKIAELFGQGKSEFVYPFKLLYLKAEEEQTDQPSLQVLISVPKRHFKRAYQRNYIKRQIREAYRKNKAELQIAAQEKGVNLKLAFIFVAKEALEYSFLERKMKELLKRLM